MHWMLMPLRRYADFRGRSRRMEYWMYILFIVIVVMILSVVDSLLGLGGRTTAVQTGAPPGAAFGAGFAAGARGGLLANIFTLATFIPSLAVAVRRLHDRERSGWWILLPLIPYLLGAIFLVMGVMGTGALALVGGLLLVVGAICGIVLLVWYCLPGTPGPNRFGPDPLDPNATANLSDVFS